MVLAKKERFSIYFPMYFKDESSSLDQGASERYLKVLVVNETLFSRSNVNGTESFSRS